MIIFDNDELVTAAVSRLTGDKYGPSKALGFVVDGRIVGGAVYSNWVEAYKSLEMSIASTTPRWCTRGAIRCLLWYAFEACGANRMQGTIRKKNRHAIKFNRRIGMVYEGKGREAFGDDDACVYSMLKSEWLKSKWHMELEDDQERRQHSIG